MRVRARVSIRRGRPKVFRIKMDLPFLKEAKARQSKVKQLPVKAVRQQTFLSRNRQVISQRPTGTAETMRADDPNVQFTGQYRLVSADDLTTSDGVGYPQQYQPRNRNRAVMRAQVANMANNLNPSAVVDATGNVNLGAPVIDESGVVLNGNGRTMAIRQAYQRNGQSAQAYKQYLKAHADAFGMTPDTIDSIENPVLVRQVGGDAPITDIIHSTAGGADMSAGEQAKKRRRKN